VISNYPKLESIVAIGDSGIGKIIIENITKVTISNCPELKKIDITDFVDNEKLEIEDCPNLEKLYCGNNNLTSSDFLEKINTEELKKIDLSSNNITSDLTFFSRFINLEKLTLGNYYLNRNDIKEGKAGFYGSLEPLRSLSKLEYLDINNNEDAYTRFFTDFFERSSNNEQVGKTFCQRLKY